MAFSPQRHTQRITQSEAHLLDTTQQERVKDDGSSAPTNIALQEFKKDTCTVTIQNLGFEKVSDDYQKKTFTGHNKSIKAPVYTTVSSTANSQVSPPGIDEVKYTPIGGFKNQHVSPMP